MQLEPWQAWVLCNVFGFIRKSDGTRRFRKTLKVVPRKNGKSAITAPVGLYMMVADGEHAAEVYAGATSEKQAWEVFRPAQLIARASEELRDQFGIVVNAQNLHVPATSSRFETIIGNPGDGTSPSAALIDEYHEHDSSDQNDTMLTGMGAREQPLLWRITTAGDNLAGPCFDEIQTGRKVLEGVIVDEELFYVEYTIDDDDDWRSADALRKANPNIDVSVMSDFLLARQREAIRNPREQGRFKTKHLNIWVNSRSAYFNMASWSRCFDPELTLESLRGRRCVIGMDLASKNDIAALQLLFELDNGKIATFGLYYLPEDVLHDTGRELYAGWANSDPAQLILTDGNMIDFDRIEADIDDIRTKFTVDEIVFDPAQATMLVTRLMNKGVAVQQFDQNARNFSEPMKQIAAEIDAGRLIHNCDPRHPMSWMLSNVTARIDAKEQVYPRKERPENKIDGPVALIMARARLMAGASTAVSVYEGRGLTVLGS